MSILTARDRANPGFLIRRIHQRAVSIFMSQLTDLGITPLQYTVLRLVGENLELDQVNIASLAGLDTSTTMDVITRLDDRGLVKRTRGLTDQRRRLAVLTPEGTDLLNKARPLVEVAQRELLSPLNKRQQAAFLNAMCLLVEGHENGGHASLGKGPWRRAR